MAKQHSLTPKGNTKYLKKVPIHLIEEKPLSSLLESINEAYKKYNNHKDTLVIEYLEENAPYRPGQVVECVFGSQGDKSRVALYTIMPAFIVDNESDEPFKGMIPIYGGWFLDKQHTPYRWDDRVVMKSNLLDEVEEGQTIILGLSDNQTHESVPEKFAKKE